MCWSPANAFTTSDMQKFDTAQTLKVRLKTVLDTVKREFIDLNDPQLNQKPANGGWSISDCLQHLIIFGKSYVNNIQHRVDTAVKINTQSPADQLLESGWLGRIAQESLNPDNPRKLPTAPWFRPDTAVDPQQPIAEFFDVHDRLLILLDRATYLDWNREKIATPYGNWLKLRLGDVLLMLVSHAERHLNQAMRVKAALFS
jgi:DinB superfamily